MDILLLIIKIILKSVAIFFSLLLMAILFSLSIWHKIAPAPKLKQVFPEDESSVTYIGHATTLIHMKKVNIITDPMYSNFILFLSRRHIKPAIPFDELPHIDAICISHEHYDHLDRATLKRFDRGIPILINRTISERIKDLGFKDIRELSPWESTRVKNITITAVPARHSTRNVIGYVIEGPTTVYFAGDTAYFDDMKKIGERFNIDVALMPISHYRSRNGNKRVDRFLRTIHMGPDDFPAAMNDLKAKHAIPIHWGTFRNLGIMELPLAEPVRYMKEIIEKYGMRDRIHLIKHGIQFKIGQK